LAQIPLVVALVFVGVIAVFAVRWIGEQSGTIIRENYRSVLATQRMIESLERMDSAALAKMSGHGEQFLADIPQHRRTFDDELHVAEGNITEQQEQPALELLRDDWKTYLQLYDEYLTASDSDPDGSSRFYFEKLAPVFFQAKKKAYSVLAINQDAMNQKNHIVQSQVNRLMVIVTGIVFFLILASLFCTSWLITQLLRPLSVLSQAVQQVGKGDWKIRIPKTGHDEISRIAGDFNSMTAHLDEYRNSSLGDFLLAKQAAQSAIDSLPDPVLICDVAETAINMNVAAERILGLSLDGHSFDRLPAPITERIQRIREFVLSGRGEYIPQGFDEAVRFTMPGKEDDFWFLIHGNPLYNESKKIVGITFLFKDISKMYRIDKLKSNLVTEVTGELHDPLLATEMVIHILAEEVTGHLNDKQKELLFDALSHCRHIRDHLDELINFSGLRPDQEIPEANPRGQELI